MYGVAVRKEFSAVHWLVGGDWGEENKPHRHDYAVEVLLRAGTLDGCGYVCDITLIERLMDGLIDRYRGGSLNELPEFAGLNPSIEHFSRIWWEAIAARLGDLGLASLRVTVGENAAAFAFYEERP
jgi:6-pyruvoyltetrahydropterin/6-carboxytetrahydropterin synthase